MKYSFRLFMLLAAASSMAGQACAQGPTQDVAEVSWRIDFTGGDSESAESFYDGIHRYDGQIIWLELKLHNKPESQMGQYELMRGKAEKIVCGVSGQVGLLDNLQTTMSVAFGHPDHNHAYTELFIGDRMRFPFQSARCGLDGLTDGQETPLHVRGYFAVELSEVPTQQRVSLFPVNFAQAGAR